LVFIGGTGARRPDVRLAVPEIWTAALPALIANLALETAPVRVNLIAPGFVDADDADDVAAVAVHLMTNTALTGVTYDVDGGRQLVKA
jgi:NAD(P)-dependent dehydrogenase (short-subunit alcohol dehydrogenase family)